MEEDASANCFGVESWQTGFQKESPELRNLLITCVTLQVKIVKHTRQTVRIFSCSAALSIRGGCPAFLISECGVPAAEKGECVNFAHNVTFMWRNMDIALPSVA